MSEEKEMFCSFCGKSSYDAKHFVMQGDVAICDMCVGACAAIMAEQDRKDSEESIPTGENRSVEGTPMDFRTPKPIGKDIGMDYEPLHLQGGYDHNFCLKGNHASHAYSTKTGITMDCYTDMPGVQFYSGNFLCGNLGKAIYPKRSGFCLETQFWPDAINHDNYQKPILKKGEKFHSQTKYVFGTK
mgnify:CR=1 FL=1